MDPAGHLAGDGAAGRGQGHVDDHVPLVRHVDAIDQAEFVDVDRDLRVVHGLELLDQAIGQGVELSLREGARRFLGGLRAGAASIHQLKNLRALTRASTKASASSRVLYRAKEARAVEVRPKRRIRGSAQCWPARTATP